MREIKFRAWDTETKEWHQGDLIITSYGVFEGYHTLTENKIRESLILCQYTGLKDKNGKEIYEGDILQCHFVVAFVDASDGANLGMSVGWYEQRDDFESFRQLEVGDELEVIGNIYENPELLGGE